MNLPLILHSRLWIIRKIILTKPTKADLQNEFICLCYSTVRGWQSAYIRVRTKSELRQMYEVLYETT